MNRHIATVGASVLLMFLGWAWAAAPGSDAPPSELSPPGGGLRGIAVVDVARVFREHAEFTQEVGKIRAELETAKQTIIVRQAEIESTQRKLQGLRAGTPEHGNAQLLLARLQTELKLSSERLQQQFQAREAALYADTYQEMVAAIEQHAQAHDLQLVLRAHDSPVEAGDRQSVLGVLNRGVLYQRDLDITDDILQRLKPL